MLLVSMNKHWVSCVCILARLLAWLLPVQGMCVQRRHVDLKLSRHAIADPGTKLPRRSRSLTSFWRISREGQGYSNPADEAKERGRRRAPDQRPKIWRSGKI